MPSSPQWVRAIAVWTATRRNGLALDAAVVLVVVLLAGLAYSWRWLELFPLIEFRQQANFHLSFGWLWDQVTLDGPNIWSVPFYFNARVGELCGTSVGCTNAFLIGINLGSAVLLYALVRRLAPWRLLAAAVTAAWLIGLPVLDSVTWQATNLDKLGVLFVLVGVHIALSFYRRGYSLERCLVANGLLLCVVVLAHNCKPAAWVIVPAMLLLPVMGGGQGAWTWIRYLLASATYAVIQGTEVLRRINADAFYSDHVSSGDVPANLRSYLGYLTGSLTATTASLVIAVVLVVVGLVRRVAHARAALWALVIFGGALAVAARAAYPSVFYMMVPSALLALLTALVIVVAIELAGRRWALLPIVLAAVLGAGYGWNIAESRQAYSALEGQSATFRAALPAIASKVPRADTKQLILVMPAANYLAYKFAPEDVEQYIYGDKTEFDRRITRITDAEYNARGLRAGEFAAIFDIDSRLVDVIRGPQASGAGG